VDYEYDEETKFEETAAEAENTYIFKNREESERFFNYLIEDDVEEMNFSSEFLEEIVNYIIAEP
jgi:hypothetical protein